MRNANKVGALASAMIAVAAGLVFLSHEASTFDGISLVLQWGGCFSFMRGYVDRVGGS